MSRRCPGSCPARRRSRRQPTCSLKRGWSLCHTVCCCRYCRCCCSSSPRLLSGSPMTQSAEEQRIPCSSSTGGLLLPRRRPRGIRCNVSTYPSSVVARCVSTGYPASSIMAGFERGWGGGEETVRPLKIFCWDNFP